MDSLKVKEMGEEKGSPIQDSGFLSRVTRNLREKRTWQIGAIILLIFLFSLIHFIFGKGKETEKRTIKKQEEPVIYREKDLKQTIQKGLLKDQRQTPRKTSKPQRRNYATEIAVFIFQEKEKRDSRPRSERMETKKLGLPAGTKIPAYLSGTLFSFNVAAPVTAIVSKDIEKDSVVVIPKDSQFLGEAGVLKSLNRINVNFDLLIFPDGRQIRIRGMALSEDGSSGIKGRVNKHRDMRVLKAIGETALAGVSLFAGGIRSEPYALEDELRLNLAQSLTGEARQDLRSVKVETSITVDSFTPIQVILLEAV